jgi:hypothetical protein
MTDEVQPTIYSKEDFTVDLQNLMEILEKSKEENDYINGAGIIKSLYEKFESIKENQYYQREFGASRPVNRTQNILSDKEKLESKKYLLCKCCDSLVLKYGMKKHLNTKKCRDIALSKEVSHNKKEQKYKTIKIIDIVLFKIQNDMKTGEPIGMMSYYDNQQQFVMSDDEESDEESDDEELQCRICGNAGYKKDIYDNTDDGFGTCGECDPPDEE